MKELVPSNKNTEANCGYSLFVEICLEVFPARVVPKEVERLFGTANEMDRIAAFKLVQEARTALAADPELDRLWNLASRETKVVTEPEGARIFIKPYDAPDQPWEDIGLSPFQGRKANIWWRYKLEKPGYDPVYAVSHAYWGLKRKLDEAGAIPARMARITDQRSGKEIFPDYYLDCYEVTNQEFKEFAIAGGYQKREYWKFDLIKDGKVLPWQEGVALMTDSTGRPGPSTWQEGDYIEGQDNFPVSGVSWYEAAAYAEYAGKQLPTIQHWGRPNNPPADAGMSAIFTRIIPFSNFGMSGTVPVGSRPGMNYFGIYDMAGNVREWCWNIAPKGRCLRGGSWSDIPYMFGNISQADPFDRSGRNGFRCAKYMEQAAPAAFEPFFVLEPRDYSREQPVSDEVFKIFTNLFHYDKVDPKAESTQVEDTTYWSKHRATFDAAYGNERMVAFLFLPKNASPPFQTVIYFPGSTAISNPETRQQTNVFDFLLKAGRAVIVPIYKGTYERSAGTDFGKYLLSSRPYASHRYTDYLVMWVKDLCRSVDYLEIRPDIDRSRLAFFGFSWGGYQAQMSVLDSRIKANILFLGGFPGRMKEGDPQPEADIFNYVTRVRVPTLMLNGRYDLNFPLDTAVKPFFDRLGTPAQDKFLKIYDSDHFVPRNELVRESLAFLDRYLGPVKLK